MFMVVGMKDGWTDYNIFVGWSWAIASTTYAIFRHQKDRDRGRAIVFGWD
jgi:hypothetical protein